MSIGNFVILKLKLENYPIWREPVLGLAESQDMLGYLIGEILPPSELLVEGSSDGK